MSGGIYLLRDNGQLVEMREQAYDSEDLLQKLLAQYPNLLAGDQMNSDVPRRWLLISREMALASEEDGAGRWSVDHLFLDQDGIPTLVEVKRSSDTRIRREVVGQMLDYAANAVVYWPVEQIKARFEAQCAVKEIPPEQQLSELLEPEADQSQFWQQVKLNLQAGRVRLVFVADVIPSELRRIVEFLNGQMDPAEVLAVELRQYIGQGLTTLVPRVIGRTEKTPPPPPQRRQWDEASFLQSLEAKRGAAEAKTAKRILEWTRDRSLRIWWGRGQIDGSFFPMLDYGGEKHFSVSVWTSGVVEIQFQHMLTRPPFDAEEKRVELLNRLNEALSLAIPRDRIDRRPGFPLSTLTDDVALGKFLDALDWFVQQVKAARL